MKKAGWKTTEFWMSLAAVVLGAFMASGLLPVESPIVKSAGILAAVLGSMGYAVGRGIAKGGEKK
tara:strand:+ start:72 stop:266 length:195 start_codon:yes stop_codon:yes gene_type:complete